MANLGQKNFNVNIDEKLADEFSEHIDEKGYTKYRALEAAIRAFMAIPPEAQVLLMSGKLKAKDILIQVFRDIDVQEHLKKLSPAQRSQLLELARQAAKTLSRKK